MRKIRSSVFETNSSSTHSLCIKPEIWEKFHTDIDFDSPYIPIEVSETFDSEYSDKCLKITTSNFYKRGDGYFLVEGCKEKIQLIISSMASHGDMFHNSLTPSQLTRFQSITKAIKDFIDNKFGIKWVDVNVKETDSNGFLVDTLLGDSWSESKYTEEEVYNIIYNILSNDNIVFTCHSDESGPFPKDIGLDDNISLDDLKVKI